MEATNQNTSESNDITDEPNENEAAVEAVAKSTATTSMVTEDTTKDEAGTSAEGMSIQPIIHQTTESPATSRRNYRRHTRESDDSSDDAEIAAPGDNNADEAQAPQSSDSEDVSLDELRVSASDEDNIHNSRR